jgi:IS30 family transposase
LHLPTLLCPQMQITPFKHCQQIQPEKRVTLATLHFQNFTVRKIARTLGRSRSPIGRELDPHSIGGHSARKPAVVCASVRRLKARLVRKPHKEGVLFAIGYHLLCLRWTPAHLSMTLSATYPTDHEHRVSHETIYNCICTQPEGELKRDLIKAWRQAHNNCVPRSEGQDRKGQIPHMVSIHVRPPKIEDRQFPGHQEGDLIKIEANGSAVSTLVKRTSRLLMLVKLPQVKPASVLNVLQGFTDKLLGVALLRRVSMAYDPGREMPMHKELSKRTGIAVYFCEPHSPWQRSSDENMNGLVRQYLSKGTDLSVYTELRLNSPQDAILIH